MPRETTPLILAVADEVSPVQQARLHDDKRSDEDDIYRSPVEGVARLVGAAATLDCDDLAEDDEAAAEVDGDGDVADEVEAAEALYNSTREFETNECMQNDVGGSDPTQASKRPRGRPRKNAARPKTSRL